MCLRNLTDLLQHFLAAVNSKINHAEHEEKSSKVEQYSVSIANTFNFCQQPHQPTAVHLPLRKAGLGLSLPQDCFTG